MKQTPEQLRERAADLREEARESFERCDTDGFLSQWAHGVNAAKAEMEADLVAAGGVWEFAALFDLEGNRVPAKLIFVADKFRGYGKKALWALLDPADLNGRFLGFVAPSTGGKRSIANLRAKGYVEGTETAPAKVILAGEGVNVGPLMIRTDGGYPGSREDAR